jgi:hypothetical protein
MSYSELQERVQLHAVGHLQLEQSQLDQLPLLVERQLLELLQ